MIRVRVQQDQPFGLAYPIEPFPAARLNHNSRWTASAGSQEQRYLSWLADVRNMFETLDIGQPEQGLPFFEPLAIRGTFWVGERWEQKDLDNLMKAVLDAHNPVAGKKWKDLRTFLWGDDRQIVAHLGWQKLPGSPNVSFEVIPLWGRIDPMLNFVEGIAAQIGVESTKSLIVTQHSAFRLRFAAADRDWWATEAADVFDADREGVEPATTKVWVWPVSSKGVFPAFRDLESLLLYRQCLQIKGLSDQTAWQLLERGWSVVAEALEFNQPKLVVTDALSLSRAATAISRLRERLANPLDYLSELIACFEPRTFEQCAVQLSSTYGVPWLQIRAFQATLSVDWNRALDELVVEIPQLPGFAIFVGKSLVPRKKVKSKSVAPQATAMRWCQGHQCNHRVGTKCPMLEKAN